MGLRQVDGQKSSMKSPSDSSKERKTARQRQRVRRLGGMTYIRKRTLNTTLVYYGMRAHEQCKCSMYIQGVN